MNDNIGPMAVMAVIVILIVGILAGCQICQAQFVS